MRFLLIFALLSASVAAVSCGRQASSGVSIDSAFKPLIPADAKALAGIDLDKLKGTPLYRRHESSLNFPLLDASSERIGLDPRRDLSYVLIAWNGKQPVFMTRGRFQASTVEQKLLALGAQSTNHGEYKVLRMEGNSLVFLKNSIGMAGPTAALETVLDTEAKREGGVPQELQERLQTVPKGDPVWVVSRGGLPFAELSMRSDYESALSNIAGYVQDTSLGIGIDTGAHIAADLTCVSEQGAQRVHDGLRAAVALGRLTTKDDQQDMLRVYDAIHVDQDKTVVRLRADFPSDLADKLLGYLPELRPATESSYRPR